MDIVDYSGYCMIVIYLYVYNGIMGVVLFSYKLSIFC